MAVEIRLLTLCAALAAGEAAAFALAAPAAALWPPALLAAALLALYGYALRWRGTGVCAVFALGFALALRAAEGRRAALESVLVRQSGRPAAAAFVVEGPVSAKKGGDGRVWASFPSTLGPLGVRVVAPCRGGTLPQEGERWSCAGWLARKAARPWARPTFWVCGRGSFARRMDGGGDVFVRARARLRADLGARAGIGLSSAPRIAALHRAILLGERSALDPSLKAEFVAAGTVHVFAISGLHVMLVARAFAFLLAWTRLAFRWSGLLVVPLVWLYAYLVGLTPSAVRAASLVTLTCLAPLFWRRPDGLVAWALTFLAFYGLAPARVFDVGSALSFAVMLALVLWGRWGAPARARLGRALGFTAVAWAASLPIAAHVFGRVTPGGLLSNLALAPLAGGSVVGAFAGVLASFVSDDLAALANNLAAVCTELMVALSCGVAALPGASFAVAPWPWTACLAWYAALALALALVRRRARRRHMV